MTILIFLGVLFALVLVHEWGHFIVAKKTGMQVDEFGIGFPPRVFSFRRGGTLYSLNLLPIGGFVKILGEDGVSDEEAGNPKTFSSRPRTAQAAVLLAGVVMNVLFAWVLFVAVFLLGVPQTVSEVSAGESASLMISTVVADSPAEDAGLSAGDTILTLHDGTALFTDVTPTQFVEVVTKGSPVTITYESKGELYETTTTPVVGLIADDPSRATIGVGLTLIEVIKEPLGVALREATYMTGHSLVAIVGGVYGLLSDAVLGQADLSEVAGPIGIAGMAGDAASFGLTSLLLFTAFISLNLAIINLLPFPALDGGRVLMVAIEGATRRRINPVWAGRLNLVGFVLLLLLMILVTYNDIGNL